MLSNQELLVILLGTGPAGQDAATVAEEVLSLAQGCLHNLASWPVEGLTLVHGIGQAKATLIAAAMELGRRRHDHARRLGDAIKSSRDVHVRFRSRLGDLQHEEFWVLLLRRSNHVLAEVCISRGGLTGTVVDPKILFGRAPDARRSASCASPFWQSQAERRRSCADAKPVPGRRVSDLPVLDWIVAGDGFVSFADQGWLR